MNTGARGSARVKLGASLFAGIALALIACGSDRPPPTGGLYAPGTSSGGASGTPFGGNPVTTTLPGCGKKDDGSYCDCVDTPLFADPPNIYFVLDRSGSMANDNKWDQVRVVVASILRGLGPRANFGATVFPGLDGASSCSAPAEVLPLTPGDRPQAGNADGPTTKSLLSSTADAPGGGTPTAAALRAVAQTLKKAQGKTFVILATDGGANCTTTGCNVDLCMPNIENRPATFNSPACPVAGPLNCCLPPDFAREACLDSANTISAVGALKAAGYPVYVIGLPDSTITTGSATYSALLDQLAVTGGTALAASPKFYKVGTSTDNALLVTLKKIAAKIVATCEFKLKEAPAAPERVNVYLDSIVVPKDPVNGWKIEGGTVTLLGSACSRVLSGDVLDVRIIAGCPTVEPR